MIPVTATRHVPVIGATAPVPSSMPQLSTICALLGDVISGQAAEALLAQISTLPETGDLIVSPTWAWLAPKIDVGRKGRLADGSTAMMPVRLDWDRSNVKASAASVQETSGVRVLGLGHDQALTVNVLLLEEVIRENFGVTATTNAPELVQFSSHRQLERRLRGLVKNGSHALWELVAGLEPFALRKLTQANGRVAAELGEHRAYAVPKVLDDLAIEELLTDLLYGDGKSSVIIRMLERSTNAMTFRRVDPMHYFAVNIRARAEEAIRRRIGDPKIGPKIRRVQAIVQASSVEELIEAYRLVHPHDALARKRAIAALTAGAEITAHQKLFHDNVVASPDEV